MVANLKLEHGIILNIIIISLIFVGLYNSDSQTGILQKSTMGLVIGYWSLSTQSEKASMAKHLDLFIYKHHCTSAEEHLKMPPSLKLEIVKALSIEGQTVLDATETCKH